MKSFKSLIKWYFSKAALPYWGILILDCLFVIGVTLTVWVLSNSFENAYDHISSLILSVVVFLVSYLISFRIFHTYDGVIRYSSFRDLLRIGESALISMLLIFTVMTVSGVFGFSFMFGIWDILIASSFIVFLMWIARVWTKTLYENFSHPDDRVRSFIFGISEGAPLAKRICSSSTSRFEVVGFVSEENKMSKRRLFGMRIYRFDKNLADNMIAVGSTTLIATPAVMAFLQKNPEITDYLVESGIKILVMPNPKEWDGKSDLSMNDLHPIAVEDLLPRDEIKIDLDSACEFINGKTVLITGAAGSIGSEMVRQIAQFSPGQLVLVDLAETPMHDIRLMLRAEYPGVRAITVVGNIADAVYMERIFSTYKPQCVFHAAAYKHVPMMEDNPYQSVVNNIGGTKIIADLAVKYGAEKFVMVSTDKAVNPTNVMGCSKRICEIYVQSLDKAIKEGKHPGSTRFVTTRFGNVLGSNGSVIPLFEQQIKSGGPVTVTHPDIIRYFMLIPEACKLVLEAGTMGHGGEIYVFDMGQPVKIVELAQRMILLSSATNIDIVFTGLRDGEKLYEEVLTCEETTLPTFHPKIKIAKVREQEYEVASREIQELIDMASRADDMEIVAKMKSIVPEFKSHHSAYEALDRVKQGVDN